MIPPILFTIVTSNEAKTFRKSYARWPICPKCCRRWRCMFHCRNTENLHHRNRIFAFERVSMSYLKIEKIGSLFANGDKEAPSPATKASPPVYEASEMGANIGHDVSDMQRLGKKQEFKVWSQERFSVKVPEVDFCSAISDFFLHLGLFLFSWLRGSSCSC